MASPVMMEPPSKRLRNDELITFNAPRTSSLPSPTIKLTGHKGSVYALQYDPAGEALVSSSFDMTCLLWDRFYGNYNVSDHIVTASADKTCGWWNANTGERIKKLQGHEGIVNAVDTIKVG